MPRHLVALVAAFYMLSACETVSAAPRWEKGMKVPVAAACKTKDAILAVVVGDKESDGESNLAFINQARLGQCVSFGKVIGLAIIGEIVERYKDHSGEAVAVVRAISPNAPGANFFLLLYEKIAYRINYREA